MRKSTAPDGVESDPALDDLLGEEEGEEEAWEVQGDEEGVDVMDEEGEELEAVGLVDDDEAVSEPGAVEC